MTGLDLITPKVFLVGSKNYCENGHLGPTDNQLTLLQHLYIYEEEFV